VGQALLYVTLLVATSEIGWRDFSPSRSQGHLRAVSGTFQGRANSVSRRGPDSVSRSGPRTVRHSEVCWLWLLPGRMGGDCLNPLTANHTELGPIQVEPCFRGAYPGRGMRTCSARRQVRRVRISPRRRAFRRVCSMRGSDSPGDDARRRAVSQDSQAVKVVRGRAYSRPEVRRSQAARQGARRAGR